MVWHVKHNRALHDHLLVLRALIESVPWNKDAERLVVAEVQPNFWRATVRFGFMEKPDIPAAVAQACDECSGLSFEDVTCYVGHDTVVRREDGHGLPAWQESLYAAMERNSGDGRHRAVRRGTDLGDGAITPAISVLSALEGLNIAAPASSPPRATDGTTSERYVLPAAVAILVALFAIQPLGTSRIGKAFGPVMALWFLAIAALGVGGIIRHPAVFAALNPRTDCIGTASRPGHGAVASWRSPRSASAASSGIRQYSPRWLRSTDCTTCSRTATRASSSSSSDGLYLDRRGTEKWGQVSDRGTNCNRCAFFDTHLWSIADIGVPAS